MRAGGAMTLGILIALAVIAHGCAPQAARPDGAEWRHPVPTVSATAVPSPSASVSPTPRLTSPMAGGSTLAVDVAMLPASLVAIAFVLGMVVHPYVWTFFR